MELSPYGADMRRGINFRSSAYLSPRGHKHFKLSEVARNLPLAGFLFSHSSLCDAFLDWISLHQMCPASGTVVVHKRDNGSHIHDRDGCVVGRHAHAHSIILSLYTA